LFCFVLFVVVFRALLTLVLTFLSPSPDRLPPPPPPTDVEVEKSIGNNTLLLTWTGPGDITMIEGYRIIVDGKVAAEIAGPDATLGRVQVALRPNTTYNISVASFARHGQSELSRAVVYRHMPSDANVAGPTVSAPISSSTTATASANGTAQKPAGVTQSLAAAPSAAKALSTVSTPAPTAEPAPAPATAPAPVASAPVAGVAKLAAAPLDVPVYEDDWDEDELSSQQASIVDHSLDRSGISLGHSAANGAANGNGSAERRRLFLVLYDYDPAKDSENENPEEELKISEGQVFAMIVVLFVLSAGMAVTSRWTEYPNTLPPSWGSVLSLPPTLFVLPPLSLSLSLSLFLSLSLSLSLSLVFTATDPDGDWRDGRRSVLPGRAQGQARAGPV
jgi:hypothetical protein